MPQSLVLNLIAQSTISQQYLQGRAPQQLFFDLVDEVDPALGNVLRQDEQNRSYSLSAIQVDAVQASSVQASNIQTSNVQASNAQTRARSTYRRSEEHQPASIRQGNVRLLVPKNDAPLQFSHHKAIAPDTRCWWRITFLDDELFDHLIFLWNQLLNEPFQLGGAAIAITNVATEIPDIHTASQWLGMSWASSCSYRDIYEAASAYERDIHLQFMTPTAFEEDGGTSPMPTAGAVFHPLRKRWNRHSGLAFAPSLVKNIVPLTFDIRTENVRTERIAGMMPGTFSGCVGRVSFRILGNDPLTTKRINALADFSYYCPVGYSTPIGLGTMRRLSESNAMMVTSKIGSAAYW